MPEVLGKSAPVPLHGRAANNSETADRAGILQALKEANGKVGGSEGAAARLGLKLTTLQSRMRKYNIAHLYR